MRGVGTAHGAFTIVNALFTGTGAAAAIDLTVIAELRTLEDPRKGLEIPTTADTPLVRAAVEAGLARWAPGARAARLTLSSEVPVARGLKSSSAVSGAILAACARAAGGEASALEIARLSADLSEAIGLSATGAFDDAYAAIAGGLALTENRERRIVRVGELPGDLEASIWVPEQRHRPSPEWKAAFAAEGERGRAIAEAAGRGRWLEAFARTGALAERVLGLEYGRLHDGVRAAGAVASAVSGLGPSLVALGPPRARRAIAAALERAPGAVSVCPLVRPGGAGAA